MEPRDRLIFALDLPSATPALELVNALAGHVGCFKIGLELFVVGGPELVRRIAEQAPVFLDLKLHDIPATVGRAAAAASALGAGVRFLTAHVDEGGRSLEAAVAGAPGVGILGVTVLTSISEEDLVADGHSPGLALLVERRARVAARAGCRGIVCSGLEASRIRRALGPGLLIVTPGVRPGGSEPGDQKRVVTPALAIENGADLIVVGRPIRDAPDPVAIADRIVEELAAARLQR
jgi:orotidine-5'-phosphate decarboxylase